MQALTTKRTILALVVTITVGGCAALATVLVLIPERDLHYSAWYLPTPETPIHPRSLVSVPTYTPPPPVSRLKSDVSEEYYYPMPTVPDFFVSLPPYIPHAPIFSPFFVTTAEGLEWSYESKWGLAYGNKLVWHEQELAVSDKPETWPVLVADSASYSDTLPKMVITCAEYKGRVKPLFILGDDHYQRRLDYGLAEYRGVLDELNVPLKESTGSHKDVVVSFTTEGDPFITDDYSPVYRLVFQEVIVSEWERLWIHPSSPTARNQLLDVLLGPNDHINFDLDGLSVLFYTDRMKTGLEPVLDFCPPRPSFTPKEK